MVSSLTRRACAAWMLASALVVIAACAPKKIPNAPTPAPKPAPAPTTPPATAAPAKPLEIKEGLAAYYGPGFEGRVTASGATFDRTAMVAAHPSYPFGTVIRVTNLANGRRVIVRVVDRGPTKTVQAEGVLIDLSSGAARNLGFTNGGRTRVRLEVLRWGK
jgi:peptidoglycan lytic transglycosylase